MWEGLTEDPHFWDYIIWSFTSSSPIAHANRVIFGLLGFFLVLNILVAVIGKRLGFFTPKPDQKPFATSNMIPILISIGSGLACFSWIGRYISTLPIEFQQAIEINCEPPRPTIYLLGVIVGSLMLLTAVGWTIKEILAKKSRHN